MENDLRTAVRLVIKIQRKEFEFERTLSIPEYSRIISKLQGAALLLSGMPGTNELIAEVDALIDEIRATDVGTYSNA